MRRLTKTRLSWLLPLPVIAVLAAAGASAFSAGDSEAGNASQIEALLTEVARSTTQGYIDDDLPPSEIDRRFDAGERLYISCGNVAPLAGRLLAERGWDSRLVATLTNHKLTGLDDGHTMLEVRTDDGWVLFDLANNRMAVDRDGAPVSFVEQMRAGEDRRWRVLAHDEALDLRGTGASFRRHMVKVFVEGGIDRWYDRVLGVALIEDPPGSGRFAFHDRSQRSRLEAYSSAYRWVPGATWMALQS